MRTATIITVMIICMAMLVSGGCDKTNAQPTTVGGGAEVGLMPPLNSVVIVTLRNDVMGTLTTLPAPPASTPTTTTLTPYGSTNVSGTLTAANMNWMVVSTTVQDYWIPMNLVVMVQVAR